MPLDPFPASYFFLLRLWCAVGLGGSDLALRALGLLIGLSLIGALWRSSYLIDQTAPLWPLALFAFSPLTLETGDSLRPYGFGLIWIVLAFGFIWKITSPEGGTRIVVIAALAAALSVQSLFTNAFMLSAIGIGAILIFLIEKRWSKLTSIIAIGLIAALTLLPYLPIIGATGEWSKIIANRNEFGSVLAVARDAIAGAGGVAFWVWLALMLAACLALIMALAAKLAAIVDLNRLRAIFVGTTLLVAAAATIAFLCAAHYLVFPRYFLPTMAVAALCTHLFWGALPNQVAVRAISLCLALLVAATSLRPLYQRANMQMSNCNKIATVLETRAGPNDLIILTSFLYGVSFQRYYHGGTNWTSVPPIADLSLHRWDLLKEAMARPDPMLDLLSRAEGVLRAGNRIFLVGKLGPPPPEQPQSLPPAPQSEFGWQMEPYVAQWKSELTFWIEHHARHGTNVLIDQKGLVNPFEQLGLFEVSGWRED